jgi:hypothetical protein
MLALDIGQQHGARDAIEHIARWRAAAPLLQPRVPGGTHTRALRHFLTVKTWRAPSRERKAE